MTINQESFKQVEDFVVGAWNIEQTRSITTKGFVKVIDEGHITYHPEENEYIVWDEAAMVVATTDDKWKAYAIYMHHVIELENNNVASMGCFKDVADVIGEAAAKKELQKVVDLVGCLEYGVYFGARTLTEAFMWTETPQGCKFWGDINNGVNPYEINF